MFCLNIAPIFLKKNIFLQHDYCLNISINVHSVSSTPSSWLVITEQISHLFCPKPLFFAFFFQFWQNISSIFFLPKYLHICFSFAQILRFVPNYHFFAQLSMFCPNITFVCLTLFYYVFISKLLVLFVCFFALISLMLCSNTSCLNYQSVFLMIPIICPSHFLNWKHYPHIYASI